MPAESPNIEKFFTGNIFHIDLVISFFANNRKLPKSVYLEGLKFLKEKRQEQMTPAEAIQFQLALGFWIPLSLEDTGDLSPLSCFEIAISEGNNLLGYTGKALCLIKDKSNPPRHPEAVELLRLASVAGCRIAPIYLAQCYSEGIGIPADPPEAISLYQMASDAGLHSASTRLAHCYLKGIGVPKNTAENIRLLQRASDAGFSEATSDLAMHYLQGIGVAKNLTRAAQLLQLASDACISEAASQLGMCYIDGNLGVPKNQQKGIELLVIAVGTGDFTAAFNLGYALYMGIGVRQDIPEAARLFRIALDGGITVAANNLARIYQEDRGVAVNYGEAFRLYTIAADAGNSQAHLNLGNCHFLGLGTPKNSTAAATHYLQALKFAINTNDAETAKLVLFSLSVYLTKYKFKEDLLQELTDSCVKICRDSRFSTAHSPAKNILSTLKEDHPENFELQYFARIMLGDSFISGWLFNSIGCYRHIALPVKELIEKNPQLFYDCVIKDKMINISYKQLLFSYLATYYTQRLSLDAVAKLMLSTTEAREERPPPDYQNRPSLG